jgi:DNA repair protein RecO (recombination protein O)
MADVHKTQAIILSFNDYTERDRLYTFFTREFGKKTVLVKGVRSEKSKMRYRLDTLNHVEIEIVAGRSFDRLIRVMDIDGYHDIKNDLDQSRLASMILLSEIVNIFLHEEHAEHELFDEYVKLMEQVRQHPPELRPMFPVFWVFRLAGIGGLGLELSHCVITQSRKSSRFGISFTHGGLIAEEVFRTCPPDFYLSKKEIILLKLFQRGFFIEGLKQYPLHSEEISRIEMLGKVYLQYLDLPVKSMAFFVRMKNVL